MFFITYTDVSIIRELRLFMNSFAEPMDIQFYSNRSDLTTLN